jgi:F-type H+-transporting ATPase subunit gamma
MNVRRLKRKLNSYIKFKDLAKSIKLIALSQLKNVKHKLGARGVALSSVVPFLDNELGVIDYNYALVVPIGVDKSCCGPHNSNIIRYTLDIIGKLIESNKIIKIITLGNRVKSTIKKSFSKNWVAHVYNYDKEPVSLLVASILVERILLENYDYCFLIFNRYFTPFFQETTCYELTNSTYVLEWALVSINEFSNAQSYFHFLMRLENTSFNNNINIIYIHSLTMVVLDMLEENEYSGLGARVTAMDNSVQSATKVIDLTSLLYNKARQSSITNELIEIVSAANIV